MIRCPCALFRPFEEGMVPVNEVIKHYDMAELMEAGWRMSTHKWFSEDGKDVWVCPDCVAKAPPYAKVSKAVWSD